MGSLQIGGSQVQGDAKSPEMHASGFWAGLAVIATLLLITSAGACIHYRVDMGTQAQPVTTSSGPASAPQHGGNN